MRIRPSAIPGVQSRSPEIEFRTRRASIGCVDLAVDAARHLRAHLDNLRSLPGSAGPTSYLPDRPLKKSRGILFAYLGIALPALVALALMPYLVRNLGPARFGVLSLMLTIVTFFNAFDFGVGIAVARSVARLDARSGARAGICRLVARAVGLQGLIGACIGVTLLLIQTTVGLLPADSAHGANVEVNRAMAFVAASIPLSLASGVVRCALEGLGRFGVANALRAPSTMATFAAPIAVSFFTSRLDLISLAILCGRALITLVYWHAWIRTAPTSVRRPGRRFLKRHFYLLLSYGGWVMVGTAAGGLITLGVLDRLLIGRIVGAASIMSYSVPSDIVLRCLLVPAGISSVLIPLFARAVATNGALSDVAFRDASRLVARHAGPLAVLVALNSRPLLDRLTAGQATDDSVMILVAMSLGFLVHATAHVPYCALQALGKPNVASLRHLAELPVYAIAVLILLGTDRLPWMGVAWSIWAIVDLLLIAWLLRRFGRFERPLSALVSGPLAAWCLLAMASAAMSLANAPLAWRLAGSAAAAVYFAWQILDLLRPTRSALEA
jgi:O-antigen/teichoic acid export membrane protein